MSGIPMVRTLVLEGVAANDLFGWSVARAGDVNSDGFSDLLVGAEKVNVTHDVVLTQAGRTYVIYGEGDRSLLPTDFEMP